MRVGIPSETKADEYRVSMTPAGVRELTERGHEVVIQQGAGAASGFSDLQYATQGATIAPDADGVFSTAEMIVKVKEPLDYEVARLRPGQILFTYLHLAPAPALTRALCESGVTAIAYETVEDRHGRLPLLAPMSEIAGRLATQAGAFMLSEAARRARRAARRSSRRRGRERDDHRRRERRPQRGGGRDRDGRRRVHLRRVDRSPARAGGGLRRTLLDGLLLDARDRGAAPAHRSGDRRRARRRRSRAVRDPREPAAADAARHGDGGRGDRPGRLL